MEVSVRLELSALVEEMTHSGAPSLDETQLKKLKNICKSSDDNLRTVYDLVMSNLSKKHSEVRLSAFQVATELFPRSHLFRQLLISDFQQLARLVTGTESKHPLPPPRPAAARLKESSLLAIRQWNEKFGEGYPKLRLGYNYLKHTRKVDFERLVAQTESARRQSEARDARRMVIARQRLTEVHTEMADQKYDIDTCLKQMDTCFNLLLPRFDTAEDEVQPLPSGAHSEGDREGFRGRALSSGSFASLGSMEWSGSETEMEGDGTIEDSLAESEECAKAASGAPGGGTLTADRESDSELSLRQNSRTSEAAALSVYGTAGGGGKGQGSGDRGKGKGKEVEKRAEVGSVSGETVKMGEGDGEAEDVSSDESEVEWEEVAPVSLTQLQQHGFIGRGVSIPIQLPTQIVVEETEDNASVLTALTESHHLLQDKYLPTVNKWLEWLTKVGGEEDLKEGIDIKSRLLAALDKYKRLNFTFRQPREKVVQDQDLQFSLPPPSIPHSSPPPTHPSQPPPTHPSQPSPTHPSQPSPTHPSQPPPTHPSQPSPTHPSQPSPTTSQPPGSSRHSIHRAMDVELEQDPTTIQAQLGAIRRKSEVGASATARATTSKQRRPTPQSSRSDVPVMPFDMDLYHWDNPEGKPLPINRVCMSSVHQYWGSERDIELCDEEKALLKCRTIQFAGKFEPVKWSCRAPLPSGRLCPRRDRLKCPFHGPIIPRDEQGNPVQSTTNTPTASHTHTPTTVTTTTVTTTTTAPPSSTVSEADYNDIEAAVFAAKGIELITKGKKTRKGRQKKHPGLTDLAAHSNTPRKRLERRVFSKRAVKKVADAMDVANARSFRDKFGDSFNYALEK